uniref:alpha/beta hydrolase family esterase n=1 Tax=Falsiroseomonas oryziterrae TaxID=2911368 RepID=UPI001F29EA17
LTGARARRLAALALALLLAACAGERLALPGNRSALVERVPGPAPTLVVLHGAALDGSETRHMLRLSEQARAAGVALVFPEAAGPFWNDEALAMRAPGLLSAVDDVAFLDALFDRLTAERIADPARIHLAGISNGGMMALRYACRRARRIASLALMQTTQPADPPCTPARPLPVLIAAGTEDPIIRWDGAVLFGPLVEVERRLSVPEGFAAWRAANGCAGLAPPVMLPRRGGADDPAVLLHQATGCRHDVATLLYEIRGGGHRLPGRDDWPLLRLFGRATPDIEAGELLLGFALDPATPPGLPKR